MQSENKMFDDFVKMVNGMAGTFAGMGREAEFGAREDARMDGGQRLRRPRRVRGGEGNGRRRARRE